MGGSGTATEICSQGGAGVQQDRTKEEARQGAWTVHTSPLNPGRHPMAWLSHCSMHRSVQREAPTEKAHCQSRPHSSPLLLFSRTYSWGLGHHVDVIPFSSALGAPAHQEHGSSPHSKLCLTLRHLPPACCRQPRRRTEPGRVFLKHSLI